MGQRLREIAGPGLQLVEQADVLDRDHGLVGEARDELDLLFGERSDRKAEEADDTESLPVADKRHANCRPEAHQAFVHSDA